MKFRLLAFLSILACLFIVGSVLAQDTVSGSWSGDWGPSPGDRNKITLDLKFDGKALTGSITGGDNVSSPIPIQKGTFDPKTGTIHMEAEANARGRAVHYVVDGKVEKTAMTGSWNHDNRKGDFKLTKK
jgi:hypothetical protein